MDTITVVLHDGKCFLLCCTCLSRTDIAILDHLIEDDSFALRRCLHVVERRIVVRALWNACEHRTFIQRQILDILAEIGACCRLNPICPLTKIDLVHIELEDFLFRILTFQLKREENFLYLAFQGSILRQIGVLCKLLCDGRATLCDFASANICPDSTHDSAWIDADVLIESIVLNGNKGILEIFWNLIDADRSAILSRMDIGNFIAVDVIDLRRCRRDDILCQIRPGIQTCREKSAANADNHDKQYQPYGENCFSENGAVL